MSSKAPSDPSSLHPERGFAATTQFPPGIYGDAHFGGIFPTTLAGHLKHIAAPIDPVIVGVINNRKLFAGDQVPRLPPALLPTHPGH